jgi:hypothetical protein
MAANLELEQRKLELNYKKSWLDFWNKLLVGGFLTVVAAVIAAVAGVYGAYSTRQSAREVELIKIDATLVSAFSSQFLAEDLGTRIRAAHLFMSIAPSDDIRARWTAYHHELTEFNSALVKLGKKPGDDISGLFADPSFLDQWGGFGCSSNTLGGCLASRPQTPLNMPGAEKFSPGNLPDNKVQG